MRLVVIAAAHIPYTGGLMERSAKRVGVEVVRYKEKELWPRDYRIGKLVHGLECVLSLPADVTHVMHLDTSDSLLLAGSEEIVQKYELMERAIVIQGEKNCYPDKTLESPQSHRAETPWHFVNSGGWIGHRRAAEAGMEKAAELAEYCDQLCWTRAYLMTAGVSIDQNCQIFQSMYLQTRTDFALSNGRLLNLKTGGHPCVLHWNGTGNQGSPYSRDGVWACLNVLNGSPLSVREGVLQ